MTNQQDNSLAEEEDSPVEEDTREEVEYHLEDHQEAHGDHPRFRYHRCKLKNS